MSDVVITNELVTRLMSRVDKTETCWLWQGARTVRDEYGRGGYGVMGVPGVRRTVRVHRISYEIHIGPISAGLLVLHRCDVRHCVRPEHLYLGTAKQNTRDMLDREREAWGERSGTSKLTDDQVHMAFRLRLQGWTQREISLELGVSQSVVSRILGGEAWYRLGIEPLPKRKSPTPRQRRRAA